MRSVLSAVSKVEHTASGLNWNLSLRNSSDAVAMKTVYTVSLRMLEMMGTYSGSGCQQTHGQDKQPPFQ
jgi:hypothetical protein